MDRQTLSKIQNILQYISIYCECNVFFQGYVLPAPSAVKTARHGATSSEPVNLRPHYVSYDDFTHDLEICSLDAEFAVHLGFVNGGAQSR